MGAWRSFAALRAYIAAEFPLVALVVRERLGCVLEDADTIRCRAEAGKLHARPLEHYTTAGAADIAVIGLPKDDNKPVFRPALSNGIARVGTVFEPKCS